MQHPVAKPRLLDQVRAVLRILHYYSRRTEKTYCYWVRFFIRFNNLRHPVAMGAAEVWAFLAWLAMERDVAAATHGSLLGTLFRGRKMVV